MRPALLGPRDIILDTENNEKQIDRNIRPEGDILPCLVISSQSKPPSNISIFKGMAPRWVGLEYPVFVLLPNGKTFLLYLLEDAELDVLVGVR